MPWLLLDVVLAVGGLVVLGVLTVRLWRQVKALGARVSAAADQIGAVQASLDAESRRRVGDAPANGR